MSQALADFVQHLDKMVHDHYSTQPNLAGMGYGTPHAVEPGRVRTRIMSTRDGKPVSVYCFVDNKTGDILKAASLKAPAKGARGNIGDPSTYQNADPYGSWLYKR